MHSEYITHVYAQGQIKVFGAEDKYNYEALYSPSFPSYPT